MREFVPTLPNSWRASAMRKTSSMPPYLWVRYGPWGIDCANLVPRRSKLGSSSFVEPGCGSTTVFLPGRRTVLLGGYVKKRDDTPRNVLRLMRARLKEARKCV